MSEEWILDMLFAIGKTVQSLNDRLEQLEEQPKVHHEKHQRAFTVASFVVSLISMLIAGAAVSWSFFHTAHVP